MEVQSKRRAAQPEDEGFYAALHRCKVGPAARWAYFELWRRRDADGVVRITPYELGAIFDSSKTAAQKWLNQLQRETLVQVGQGVIAVYDVRQPVHVRHITDDDRQLNLLAFSRGDVSPDVDEAPDGHTTECEAADGQSAPPTHQHSGASSCGSESPSTGPPDNVCDAKRFATQTLSPPPHQRNQSAACISNTNDQGEAALDPAMGAGVPPSEATTFASRNVSQQTNPGRGEKRVGDSLVTAVAKLLDVDALRGEIRRNISKRLPKYSRVLIDRYVDAVCEHGLPKSAVYAALKGITAEDVRDPEATFTWRMEKAFGRNGIPWNRDLRTVRKPR